VIKKSSNKEFQELPDGWKVVKLGDVIDIQGGSQPPKKYFIYEPQEGYIRLLQIRDFGDKPAPTYVPREKVTKFCVKDDIFIARYGASLGRIVTGMEGAYNVALAKVIFDKEIFFPKYLFYLLQTPYFQTPIHMISRSAQNGFNKGEIYPIRIPLAPIGEQKHIIEEIEKQFSHLDEAVENLRRVKANLKQYKASVLKAAVEGKLTEEWRKNHPDVEPADRLQQNINSKRMHWIEQTIKNGESEPKRVKNKLKKHKFKIPKSWNIPDSWVWSSFLMACKIVVDCHNKTAPYEIDGIPLVRTTNIKSGCLLIDEVKYVSQKTYEYWSRRCYPEPGDILFTREAPMGEATIIPKDIKLCMGQRTMLLRVFSECLDAKYLLYVIMSPPFQQRFGLGAVGSGVKHLRVGDVESLSFPLPPFNEQLKIVEIVEQKLSIVNKIKVGVDRNLRFVDHLRQSILKKAFTGKLVPRHDADEPIPIPQTQSV
jgi:type I restriction enzyme, S subunit